MSNTSREITIYHLPLVEWAFAAVGVSGVLASVRLTMQIGPMGLLLSAAGGLLAAGMVYLALHPPIRLRVTDEGLYTGQYKLTIPWNCIAEIFEWEPNLDLATRAVLTIGTKGKRLPAVIGIKLTQSGLDQFGQPAHKGIYKGLYKGCDVAIRTVLWNFFSAKVSEQDLITELANRVPTLAPAKAEPSATRPDGRRPDNRSRHPNPK